LRCVIRVDPVTIKLGFQIPNFSYGTGVERLFPTVIAQAREAESAGFDSVFVMDHFYQLPMLGSPDEPMLEAYTALGALATATERVQLGTLVTGNTYRNPTLLAKAITTLDVVSAGRAILGVGAGWFELEHRQLGFEFGTFTERFNRLEEALQILDPMIKGERSTFSGEWYTTDSALAEPRYRDRIPIMIGGSGEKKTFSLAARYADHLNIIAAVDALPGKLDALAKRCDEAGRDRKTLETSVLLTVVLDEEAKPDESGRTVVGSAERIAEQIKVNVLDVGIDGVIINMPGYTPGVVAAVGDALRLVVGL
jgi:F420-dependent oxidoreductase-like protein